MIFRIHPIILTASLLASQVPLHAADPPPLPSLIWQPVLDLGAVPHPRPVTSVNPFVNYTHLGTDFGFHGPAEGRLLWENGRIQADLTGLDLWAGMWHSLEGMARSAGESLDFAAPYPLPVAPASQPRITKVGIDATGTGRIKLEIKSSSQEILWQHSFEVEKEGAAPLEKTVDPLTLRRAKLLVWTAEPGSHLWVRQVRLGVETKAATVEEFALRASFAQLARCYSQGTGMLRDRAHVPHGAFDSIPASGLFALATAAASCPEAGLVTHAEAIRILREVEQAMAAIEKAHGILPHFVREHGGVHVIHPGTEYSTVDTAIAYQCLLLAAGILKDDEVRGRVLAAIREIDFAPLTLEDGSISHGLRDNGTTVIPYSWRDWGGESALVVLLRSLAESSPPAPVMAKTGWPWQGTGFIAELQSLLHPDFDRTDPDAVTGVNWLKARLDLLAAQKSYWPANYPDSTAAKLSLYGLSASESVDGMSYRVNGVDLLSPVSLQPHYMLMAAALDPNPAETRNKLTELATRGWLAPWGMVETFSADGKHYLPMIGALNAGFEALGAYHFLVRSRHQPNAIYEASRALPEIREAMKTFYR